VRFFAGYRPNPPEDYKESGLANPAEQAQYFGIEFPDGSVSIRWLTAVHSFSNFDSIADWKKVHYHPEYGTWLREVIIDDLTEFELMVDNPGFTISEDVSYQEGSLDG
jgi:hypothetical protein